MGVLDHYFSSYVKMGKIENLGSCRLSHAKRVDQLIAIQSVRFMIYKNIPEVHYKITTIEGFPMQSIKDYNITPCDVIFNYVKRPKDYLMCKSINVYDNRWRVNIYSKRYVEGIEGKYISSSYFVHFNSTNGNMEFVLPKI